MGQAIDEELALHTFFRAMPAAEAEERAWQRLIASFRGHEFTALSPAEGRPAAWIARGAVAIGLILLGVSVGVGFRLAQTSPPATVARNTASQPTISAVTISHRVGEVTLEERQAAETPPSVARDQATAVALQTMGGLNSGLTRYEVTSIYHAPALLRATDESGNQIATFSPAIDAWVIQLGAPAQGGYTHIVGLVVLDAKNGEVKTASLIAEGAGISSSSTS